MLCFGGLCRAKAERAMLETVQGLDRFAVGLCGAV